MPWVRFTADFDFKPKPNVTQAFQEGQERNVTTPCADAAIANGKAVKLPRKRKSHGDHDQGS